MTMMMMMMMMMAMMMMTKANQLFRENPVTLFGFVSSVIHCRTK